jgi:hypothetical protein
MADLQSTEQSTAPEATAEITATPETVSLAAPMTNAQADQILAELKTIKQYLLLVLLLGGFFAARAFFFHY